MPWWMNAMLDLDPDWRRRSFPATNVPMPPVLRAPNGAESALAKRTHPPKTARLPKRKGRSRR
jgi:hypothetical protein